ncbi:MAG: ATP-dependent protease ATPase subunit HslU [Clostridia bacterium]|nr:ATP-dependent protease ATPase subunit HslU [Clostridia bacterium]
MNLSPRQIVEELDKYIIGQPKAKRAVAIALRNRYRRSKLPKELREEITPKNIIMKGPTGVGKTEIARRLAKLVKAPFIKIEATKYTEVGYVGRDVESMVRDLVETAVRMVKDEKAHEVESKVKPTVDAKLIDAICDSRRAKDIAVDKTIVTEELAAGKLEDEQIEINIIEQQKPMLAIGGPEINLGSMFDGMMPPKRKKRKLTVAHAREVLTAEECERVIDKDNVFAEAIKRTEEEGIIFIDEIDKIIGKAGGSNHQDVSREGVQRDILPIVEGSTVATKYGNVKTDFILFIASGAFHLANIEDMIPELQGRFPIRVELDNLTKDDFKKILSETKNSIILQYASILKVDNIELKFTDDAMDEIAQMTEQENESSENIGARRLHTIMELLLEDISFNATGDHPLMEVVIDRAYVQNAFKETSKKYDIKKFIL